MQVNLSTIALFDASNTHRQPCLHSDQLPVRLFFFYLETVQNSLLELTLVISHEHLNSPSSLRRSVGSRNGDAASKPRANPRYLGSSSPSKQDTAVIALCEKPSFFTSSPSSLQPFPCGATSKNTFCCRVVTIFLASERASDTPDDCLFFHAHHPVYVYSGHLNTLFATVQYSLLFQPHTTTSMRGRPRQTLDTDRFMNHC
ncbi:hypothetical protein GGP41_003784 [Bipolaris sorokiniana]|uniref:Uncharacterized protein n=1 Tax=Cochliobolus sativus TaxID=45130 RepID=A0A8H5ZE66_COCSA|nr:hypothetical protein GGP41_003784 [Bipolaris sorokiniana]